MTRKWLLCVLALIPAALQAQVAPDRAPRADRGEPAFKNQVFAGFAYTSLNQVNQSRYGLLGANIEYSRNFGRFFALTGDGAYFFGTYACCNPGDPKVWMVLGGPELHASVYGSVNLYFRGLIGGEHTGGVGITPDISFAGGPGGGMEYEMTPRWVLRAGGDYILASFSQTNNSPELGYSPHRRGNARATIGVAYRF